MRLACAFKKRKTTSRKPALSRNGPGMEFLQTCAFHFPLFPSFPLYIHQAPLFFLTSGLITCHPRSHVSSGDSSSLLFQPGRQWISASCCGQPANRLATLSTSHILSRPALNSPCAGRTGLDCAELGAPFSSKEEQTSSNQQIRRGLPRGLRERYAVSSWTRSNSL